MRILVACEFSGIVRDAFRAHGHDAVSCDVLPTESPGPHICGDALKAIHQGHWDLMIAHPPCTYLAVSGARWFKDRQAEQAEALVFVQALLDAPIEMIVLENPISVISTRIRKPDQIVQPWQFGHRTTKATCLWLKGLPLLRPTSIVSKGERRFYASGKSSPLWQANTGGGCGKRRSVTFSGLAEAMASQWG